jgi:hypothetical protein
MRILKIDTHPSWRFIACLSVLLAAVSTPLSAQSGIRPDTQTVVNRDGSRLQLVFEVSSDSVDPYAETGGVASIAYAAPGADNFEPWLTLGSDAMGESLRGAVFADIDGDGFYDVETIGMCGAGPNCWHELYRMEPESGILVHLLSDGYADWFVLDGHLVVGGRARCCSWEFHAWRLEGHDLPLTYENMDMMVIVGADLFSDTDLIVCSFQRNDPREGWRIVEPPAEPAWLSLCELYDEPYRLTPPDPVQAGAPPA